MKKIAFLCILNAFLYATSIAKIAAVVNNEAITTIDVETTAKYYSISNDEALNFLIQNKLCTSLAKSHQLVVNEEEIQDGLELIAKKNNLSKDELIAQINDINVLDHLMENIKDELLKQKLFELIAQTYSKQVSDVEALNYYQINKHLMQGMDFEDVKQNIKIHLSNENAQEAIKTYLQKEESKAKIKIF